MNLLEEAIIYATIMHQGKTRKFRAMPYILHPLEVAEIIATLTDDQEVIAAGVLHDIVEDTDGTAGEIRARFGDRVAELVASETENKYPGEKEELTWKKRKEESLLALKKSTDPGVKMLWLADKLSNVRSLAARYSELGEKTWESFHQQDPEEQRWYYQTLAEYLELDLNRTGAYKELIKHINFIWPGTFDVGKTRYRSYREVSVEGCAQIGHGAKGDVYRYDDELVIKVYNENNTYHEVEREIEISRRAFVLGLPTAISFGIVSVGNRYGAMFELFEAETVSQLIAKDPGRVAVYARQMAQLAKQIHETTAAETDVFPDARERLLKYTQEGIGMEEETLAGKVAELIRALPDDHHMVHGDFHTGNVFLKDGEPVLIDLDRMSVGNPVVDLSGIYAFYVAYGEDDPKVVENYMGFSYETAKTFYDVFIREYLGDADEETLFQYRDRFALLAFVRRIWRIINYGKGSGPEREKLRELIEKVRDLIGRVDTLAC